MSWLVKAESILNKLDQSAGTLLASTGANGTEGESLIQKTEIPIENGNENRRVPPRNNVMVLKSSTPKKKKQAIDSDEKILDIETQSQKSQTDASSVISKHDTIIDKRDNDDQSSVASKSMISSTTSLQQSTFIPFSVEKELSNTKLVMEELKAERNELKLELESLMETMKSNNNQARLVEMEDLCNQLLEEKENLVKM
jgi:hypothetical protein